MKAPHTIMIAHTQGEQTSRSEHFDIADLADSSTVTLHLVTPQDPRNINNTQARGSVGHPI